MPKITRTITYDTPWGPRTARVKEDAEPKSPPPPRTIVHTVKSEGPSDLRSCLHRDPDHG